MLRDTAQSFQANHYIRLTNPVPYMEEEEEEEEEEEPRLYGNMEKLT